MADTRLADAIARVRELAALRSTDAMRQHFGDEDGNMARAATLGALQEAAALLADLADRSRILEQLRLAGCGLHPEVMRALDGEDLAAHPRDCHPEDGADEH